MAAAAAADGVGPPPFSKISISGPALASIIQRFASSPGDIDGLLFGHVTRLPPPDPRDDYDHGSPSSADSAAASNFPLAATITGHLSLASPASFYDALGRLHLPSFRRAAASAGHPASSFLGWFSGRRGSPLRPSMRERAVSLSLFRTLASLDVAEGSPSEGSLGSHDLFHRASIFLLMSSSTTGNQAVHTHEYRAFVLRPRGGGGVLEPSSLAIVNVGPAFRAQYSSFSAESAIPWMPCRPRGFEEGERETGNKRGGESLNHLRQLSREQHLLDLSEEGFGVDRLGRLVGPAATGYTLELEDMYEKMLLKLESLAKLVEESSVRVFEQEACCWKHTINLLCNESFSKVFSYLVF
ncbi:hypothetical protein Cni_G15082 [Canna indica]|uniref:Uncharacterized protein n=1 Tax=Canna indica TaxID=4628 RepID=A0AAQ3KFF2_9LILI|nr:hypothetical protein Cni_G15082 [Canna indica]